MDADGMNRSVEEAFERLRQARENFRLRFAPQEVGTVSTVSNGIARVAGLPGVAYEELLEFPGGHLGIAFNVEEESIGVILLGRHWDFSTGDEVRRTGRVMDVPVGEVLIGRIINPLGEPVDEGPPLHGTLRRPIERPAPAVLDRAPVETPLQTGIIAIDAMVPVGRGQRELILGDRQTGKSALAIDTILNQKNSGVLCVYCAIGQRTASVAKAVDQLRRGGALAYTVVVVAEGNDQPGLSFIAPYSATTIAEHFMEAGKDVLIVYDDLTHHARAYREISLLMRRPPGREAYPGDIFYIHSRLLERAARLSERCGGGSLTALPIVETEEQQIAAYIPTNLISITDGQIYLSPVLFDLGILPAVDVGRSISRVGGKAQLPIYRMVAGALKLKYSQFEELESFSRFGTRINEQTLRVIEHGKRIRQCLKQRQYEPLSVPEQIVTLMALTGSLMDDVPLETMEAAKAALAGCVRELPEILQVALRGGEQLDPTDQRRLLELLGEVLEPYRRS